jgi:hypothetical protein
MGVVTTCPACQSSFKVKETLRGKRIRCRHCQNPVLVAEQSEAPAEVSGMETSINIDVWEDTQESLPLTRIKYGAEEGVSPKPKRSFWVSAAENPLIALGIFFFVFWLPFSLAEPKMIIVADVALAILAGLGLGAVVFLELLRVKIENPLDIINRGTVGVLAQRFVSPEEWALAQSTEGPASRDGESMTPAGRRLASQFGILCGTTALHAVVLWALRQSDVL